MTTTTPTTATLTPYKCAKVVNDELKKRGVEKTLPPQMFYTYTKKGYIENTLVDGKRLVSMVALQKWFEGYFNKLTGVKQEVVEEVAAEMQDEVDPNQLSFEDLDEVVDTESIEA